MVKPLYATYRLQFNSLFTFKDAIAVVDYLAKLGISHIYASPYLQPAKGSSHCYDVADHTRVNIEIGGNQGFRMFCQALAKKKLGHVVDIVPNHMTSKSPDNKWWFDVLKHGLMSRYAEYFDINWQHTKRHRDKILLPILETSYKKVLRDGKIQLQYHRGVLVIKHYDQIFPLAPHSLSSILLRASVISGSKSLGVIAKRLKDSCHNKEKSKERYHTSIRAIESQLKRLQKSAKVIAAIKALTQEINHSSRKLDDLLRQQNYCLVFWRVSKRILSYRRFFHIDSFIGLRMEKEPVFNDVHRLVSRWFRAKQIDGMRIDHIDGLRDPEEYLDRLRSLVPKAWLIVEKILIGQETLKDDWPVSGTTGYDFLNSITELFVNSQSEKAFTQFYRNIIQGEANYHRMLREKKILVMHELLGGDVNFLLNLLKGICRLHRLDFAENELCKAFRELIACLPAYRTYTRKLYEQGKFIFLSVSKTDKKIICESITRAKSNQTNLDPNIFKFLESLLLAKCVVQEEYEFIMRLQQFTGAVMAKGGEDTSFYCFNRFVALNEVGNDPSVFGISVESFHRTMSDSARLRSQSMLATSTHDTKRSGDLRARLTLLSEIPEAWFDIVKKWIAHSEEFHANNIPDRNTQYFLYQNLVGVWPIAKERFKSFMEKAIREAKVHTNWDRPNILYERRVFNFLDAIFADPKFLSSLETFVAPLIKFGRINSLAQVAIKLTAPGISDFYQGSELWNLDFVDPDNRRAVDFKSHYALFKKMQSLSPDNILDYMNEGLPKMWLIYKTLNFRKKFPELLDGADYSAVILHGEKKQHGIAFLRGGKVFTLVPRFIIALEENWKETYVDLPSGKWHNILTDEDFSGGRNMVKDLLRKFPVGIFNIIK